MKFLSPKFVLLMSAAAVMAVPHAANAFSDKEKAELGSVIREYVLENPSLILEAVEKHRANEEANAADAATKVLKEKYDVLAAADLPTIGNVDGDVTIIEFMDYNCGYCKRAVPDLVKLVAKDDKVKVIFHEMPVLGPTSRVAAQWALAAHNQGKYFEYHIALMEHRGSKSEKELVKLAQKLDLDVVQMKEDANSDAVKEQLATSFGVARSLGLQGTPAFIVGDQVFRGYIGHDGLIAAIESAREKG